MYISDLALTNFRSYADIILHFSPGVTVFVGENGQGKTNLVEAIAYFATFSSHRVGNDAALVKLGQNQAIIRAKAVNAEKTALLELEIIAGKANRARLNRGNIRASELLGLVKTVVFAPEDLQLIKGEPGVRRAFLDTLMIQQQPRLAAVKQEYEKVLKQRAALLKSAGKIKRRGKVFDDTTLTIWDQQLARLGAQIIVAREKMVYALQPHVKKYYEAVSGGKGEAKLTYEANINKYFNQLNSYSSNIATANNVISEDKNINMSRNSAFGSDNTVTEIELILLQALTSAREAEIERGINLVGPHRDELLLELGDFPVKGYASHGETWSYALALRLASWELLRLQAQDIWDDLSEPILILDDVFAELDAQRRERLAQIVKEAEQVFVTCAVAADLPTQLVGDVFQVSAGIVTQISAVNVEE